MLLKIVCFLPHSVSWSYFKTGSECAAAIVHASRTLCMLSLAQGPKDYSWKLQKRLGAVLKKPGREQSPESCHTQRLSKLLRYRKLIFVDLITTSLHYKNGRVACNNILTLSLLRAYIRIIMQKSKLRF